MVLREAVVAGQFYTANKDALERQLSDFFSNVKGIKRDADAVVSPHAGYIYSGQVAAYSFSALKKFSSYVVLSPNHTGLGSEISIFPAGSWETPLGRVEIDEVLAGKIAGVLGLGFDETAHLGEHSIEVQLPFMQHSYKQFKLAAITLATHNPKEIKRLAKALLECSKEMDFGVVASSDFSHYVPLETAKEKDFGAIGCIKKLDTDGFLEQVFKKQLSICGFAAIAAAIEFSRLTGKKKAELLKYDTSASAGQGLSAVVGYAALKFV